MNIRLRIATPQDAQLIHDTYGHYVLTSTATFNEVNSSVEARAEEIRSQLELYPWLIAEDETGRYLGYACAEAFRPQTGYRYFAELTIFLAPDAPRRLTSRKGGFGGIKRLPCARGAVSEAD